MSLKYLLYPIIICSSLLVGCEPPTRNPNILYSEDHEDPIKSLEPEKEIEVDGMPFQQSYYVPIYSNLYVDEDHQKVMLSATLSIRNTSLQHSIYVSKIDYYNTGGDFLRSYIEKPIELPPMGTLNYIVEKYDDTGGDGANFVVDIESNNTNVAPTVEATMLGSYSNKGFAFNTQSTKMPAE